MKLSARNQIKGRVRSVEHGAVNSVVVIALPGDLEIVSVITRASAESMALEPGREAWAVVKASNVMVAVD